MMNTSWKDFLSAQHAQISPSGDAVFIGAASTGPLIFHLGHLSVLTIAGKDAGKFLQGQCTCDIYSITDSLCSMGAFCNAKGRAIATFLAAKKDAAYLIVLPAVLAAIVKNHLQRYILRAAVSMSDDRNAYCPIGIERAPEADNDYPLSPQVYGVTEAYGDLLLHLPASPPRYLLLASATAAPLHWENLRSRGFNAADTALWRSRDITAGIPWLDLSSSEQFIPQMLNLDRLGGIGFSKGCYTGQEVVARTQYLGSVKRRMYYAECPAEADVASGANILDRGAEDDAAVGKLLAAQRTAQHWQMLAVLQTGSAESKNLRLQNLGEDKISIKPLLYVTDAAD